MPSSDKRLQCVVVTPERSVLDEACDFVALPLYDGELGVLPGRAPLIGRLGYGELRIRRGGQTRRLYVDGGFAQVRSDIVTVLTQKALRAEEIPGTPSAGSAELHRPPDASLTGVATGDRARAQARVARRARRQSPT